MSAIQPAARFETLTNRGTVAFPEYDAPPAEPIGLLRQWLARAAQLGVREPRAMALATADRSGRTSTRIIAFSKLTDRGVVFTTHSTSQKGRELAVNPWASGLLYWRETGQQVSVSGPVRQLSNAAADALWFARPVALHSMSAVSHQSAPLLDAAALLADAQRLQATGTPLPRPARFAAYRLDVDRAEFWAPSEDRLHRRLRYERVAGGWRATRLQP